MYVTIDQEKRITGNFCGDPAGIEVKPEERLQEVPEDFDGIVGTYEDEYDENWRLRRLVDRLADGTARDFPSEMTIGEDGEPRYKTRLERVLEGSEELDPTEKIVNMEIVPKSPRELVIDGLITREEWLDAEIRPERDTRVNEIDLAYCNAMEWELMDASEKQAWRDYKQALRDFPAIVDSANVVWPKRPGI